MLHTACWPPDDPEPPLVSCPVPVPQWGGVGSRQTWTLNMATWGSPWLCGLGQAISLSVPLFPPPHPRWRKTVTSHPWLSQRDDSDVHLAQSPRCPCIAAVLLRPPPPIHVGILVAWRPSGSLLDPHTLGDHRHPPPPPLHELLGVTMQRKRSCPGSRGCGAPGQGCRREITRWPRLPGT